MFKSVAALTHRFAAWGWPLVSGVIDLVLGVMILLEWPASARWVSDYPFLAQERGEVPRPCVDDGWR